MTLDLATHIGDGAGFGLAFPAGSEVLDDLRSAYCRYVAFPSPQAADAAVLWTAATHAIAAWEHAPRLVARSPEKRCGKSRLMDVIAATCRRPLMTANASTAAVYRSIGDDPPTLLVDEADTIFGSKKVAENNEDLRGLLNAGHQRGRMSLRCVGPQQTPTQFDTFAMVMLAGIGAMPDTIEDRGIVLRMRRRAPGEHVAAYRTRRDSPGLYWIRDRLAEWVEGVLDDLAEAEPVMPLEDRAADTWEPLIAVADAAGGQWPSRARAAAVFLVSEAEEADGESSLTLRLLSDIKAVFEDWTVSFLPSQELVSALCKLDEAPWREDFLSTTKLAAMLRGYGIKPGRNPARTQRGYSEMDFADAFARYLRPNPSGSVQTGSDLGERADASFAPDGSTRPVDSTRPEETAGQTPKGRDRTGSDALPTVCATCGDPMDVYEAGQTTHPGCDRAAS